MVEFEEVGGGKTGGVRWDQWLDCTCTVQIDIRMKYLIHLLKFTGDFISAKMIRDQTKFAQSKRSSIVMFILFIQIRIKLIS